MREQEFDSVLRAARTGAEWAWRHLYEELAPVVLGYLRQQRAPSPEDVLGEVFLQVVRDLHRFEGDLGGFRSWVFTIAHHRLIDARRKEQRRRVEPQPAEDVAQHLPPEESETRMVDQLASQDALELLELLTPDQRDVLLLRVVGDLTVREVAETLDKTEGAVKALQRRALSALEKHLPHSAYPEAGEGRSRG